MKQVTKDRWFVLYELMKNKNPKVGIEIGVQKGLFTRNILSLLSSIETYYAIDPWLSYDDYVNYINNSKYYNQNRLDKFLNVFKEKTKKWKDKIKILRMLSSEAVNYIEDESIDFCFIDGNHIYDYVMEDIKLYLPKMKKGGLIGGHDYEHGNDYGHSSWGVEEAVNDYFGEGNFFVKDDYTWWKWV